MPRVNRDLQRRLAARRERDRRRPASERRYQFQTGQPESTDLELEEEVGTDGAAHSAAIAGSSTPTRARRQGRSSHSERVARPFADYALEYAYVVSDLRRLGLVVAAILVVLAIMYVFLPR